MGTPRTGPAAGPFARIVAIAAVAIGTVVVAQQPPAKPPVLVEGARILDVARGRYLAPAAVYIENGRIKSVTPEPPSPVPDGTVRVKAAGPILVPGLIDAHAWAAPVSGLEADYFYLVGLAHGVTGYRVLNVRTNWGVAQRARSIAGGIMAPRLWTSGRGINQGAEPRPLALRCRGRDGRHRRGPPPDRREGRLDRRL